MKTTATQNKKEKTRLFSFGNTVISVEGLIVLITKQEDMTSSVFEGVVLCGKFETGSMADNFIKDRFNQFEGTINFEL